MQIEVIPGVFWDTEKTQQSEAAIEWLQTEVRPNLSIPSLDEFKRPYERNYENDKVILIERQMYLHENSDWARRGVEIIVTEKGGSDETI